MWFHYDFMLRCGVNRGMRTFVLLTRIAVHASACRKSSESHTFFQSIHQDYVLPSFLFPPAISVNPREFNVTNKGLVTQA